MINLKRNKYKTRIIISRNEKGKRNKGFRNSSFENTEKKMKEIQNSVNFKKRKYWIFKEINNG